MSRYRQTALALCALIGIDGSAEPPAWLDDWYEIEVIIFVQPTTPLSDEGEFGESASAKYAEQLLVSAPEFVNNITRTFPLTELERARIRERSEAVDLSLGNDSWFRISDLVDASNPLESGEKEFDHFGTFPDWMLPPGDSYESLFIEAFRFVPFGGWFADLSLASLIEKDDDDADNEDDDSALVDDALVQSNEEIVEDETTREEVLEQIEAFRNELERTSYAMDEQNVRLPRTSARLRSSGAHVIKHFNWHQFVPSLAEEPIYVYFQSLDGYETEGYFGISKGRFVHLDVHLWIHQPTPSSEIRFPVYELAELRRMQSDAVHYFDHPKFGVLAEVVKVELPPDLQALWDSLD